MEAIRAAGSVDLERLARDEPRAVRHLLGRLWDPDEPVRRRAGQGVGAAAAAHPDVGVDVARRMTWAFNDESATKGVCGLTALGEIGFRPPGVIAACVDPIASPAWDKGLRAGIVKALRRIGEPAPEPVEPHRDLLLGTDDAGRVEGCDDT
jgi:hypothetical protein